MYEDGGDGKTSTPVLVDNSIFCFPDKKQLKLISL